VSPVRLFYCFSALFIFVFLLAAPAGALSGDHRAFTVFAVNDGEKIEQDNLNHHLKRKNSLWNGRRIEVYSAKNEIIAFQVIVQSRRRPVRRLRAKLNHLTHQKTGQRIIYQKPSLDPSNSLKRPIQLFTTNYMKVTHPSSAGWIYQPGSPSAPPRPTGLKPVQLVPENAKRNKGGLPIRIEPRSNQSLWFEIYVEPNKAPGTYHGIIRIRGNGKVTRVPLTLKVFDFAIPDQNSINMMLYHEDYQVDLYHGADRELEYHRFAHRNRVELVKAYNSQTLLEAAGRFNGSDFSTSTGYQGPGQNTGNRIAPLSFYWVDDSYLNQALSWSRSNSWMTFLSSYFPSLITFLYVIDEPTPSQYPYVRTVSKNIKSGPAPGSSLPILVTRPYTQLLRDDVDIWVSPPTFYQQKTAELARSLGDKYWLYNGGRPHAGSVVIDSPATDPRSIIWACFKHSIETYFFWHGVHWHHNHQKPGQKIQNVWNSPITFDNRGQPGKPASGQGFANGEGVLIYPGEEILHPEEDRGIKGPISTIQLANFRRGLQDHQYLTLARNLGLDAEVASALNKTVPLVLSDTHGENIGFSQDGDTYEKARVRLGHAIESATKLKKP